MKTIATHMNPPSTRFGFFRQVSFQFGFIRAVEPAQWKRAVNASAGARVGVCLLGLEHGTHIFAGYPALEAL